MKSNTESYERMKARRRERYQNDPEYREARRAKSKAYYDKVKDTEEFKQKNRARVATWRKDNPEHVKAYLRSESRRAYDRAYYQAHKHLPHFKYTPTEEQKLKYAESAKRRYEFARQVLTDPEFAAKQPADVVTTIIERYERQRARQRAYYAKNPEKYLTAQRKCRQANREKYREISRNSYHRRMWAKVMSNRNNKMVKTND